MKRVLLVLVLVVALAVATASPALATTTLELPSGNSVEGLPDAAANAGNSGQVGTGGSDPCVPPDCGGGGV